MMLIPYRVDVPLFRRPYANYALLVVIVLCYCLQMANWGEDESAWIEGISRFGLTGWDNPLGFVGHIFLHGGLFHLVGNCLFLWVFGNAVCEKVGNIAYPFIFLGLGIAAGAAHLMMSSVPVIGASGAINGVVGMFLVWFPLNEISCFYLIWIFFFIRYGWFELSSYWMILLWFVFDVFGAAIGGGEVAHWAHLGGFAAGAVLAAVLTKLDWVSIYDDERTLLDVFHLGKPPPVNPLAAMRSQGTFTSRYEAYRENGKAPAASQRLVVSPPPPPPPPIALDPIPFEPPTTIRFRCECGKSLQVGREKAGKLGRCPGCAKTMRIPDA